MTNLHEGGGYTVRVITPLVGASISPRSPLAQTSGSSCGLTSIVCRGRPSNGAVCTGTTVWSSSDRRTKQRGTLRAESCGVPLEWSVMGWGPGNDCDMRNLGLFYVPVKDSLGYCCSKGAALHGVPMLGPACALDWFPTRWWLFGQGVVWLNPTYRLKE